MARYTIKRLLTVIPTVIVVVILVFTLLYLTPSDPAAQILGDTASETELEAYREYLGLNKPYIVQLGEYLYRFFIKFDLGESWIYKTNISDELATRLPYTIGICVYSVLIGALIGIPLGVTAAVNQDRWPDKIILVISSIMQCIPNFCIAVVLIVIFALKLDLLPVFGISDGIKSYILPCVAIAAGSFAGTARQMRSSMLEVLRSDYVIAAVAQGYSKKAVHYLHALPNAMIPIITMMGTQLAAGLGGTMILETIFSIPGVGLYVSGSISKRDIPAVMGCVVFLSVTFCVAMVLIDLCYAAIDPRIKAQFTEKTAKRRHDLK